MAGKLTVAAVLSSLVLILAASRIGAHEVSPSIGDFSTRDGQFQLELRLNLEAILAGIDLDGVTDTDETEAAAGYDALRALSPFELEQKFQAVAPKIISGFHLRAGGQDVRLGLQDIRVEDINALELPRVSFLKLVAGLPDDTTTISFGWDSRFGTLVLRQNGVKEPYTGYLTSGQSSPEITITGGDKQTGWQMLLRYIPVGFDHILPKGLDHILFVLGLFFLSTYLRPLLWQITAFTLAHTVTLALGAMGWVVISPAIVEPLIAASIAYVAVENIFMSRLSRWRPVVIFGFGLLHGLGFASVLAEFGIPDDQFFPALIGFNIGVELGQLAVIAAAFLAVGVWFRHKKWYRSRISVPASVLIAVIGVFWFFERIFM